NRLALVELVYLSPIDLVLIEHIWDAPPVCLVAIGAELDTTAHPALEVVHERQTVLCRALTDEPRRDELSVGAYGNPCPYVAVAERALVFVRDVFLLGVAEAPHLVALDGLA